MLAKLYEAGVGTKYLNFLDSYLAPRKGRVVVQGAASHEFVIDDSVFQGTVLGPPLWNTFFADVSVPAASTGGQEAVFADDLNVFNSLIALPLRTQCCRNFLCAVSASTLGVGLTELLSILTKNT